MLQKNENNFPIIKQGGKIVKSGFGNNGKYLKYQNNDYIQYKASFYINFGYLMSFIFLIPFLMVLFYGFTQGFYEAIGPLIFLAICILTGYSIGVQQYKVEDVTIFKNNKLFNVGGKKFFLEDIDYFYFTKKRISTGNYQSANSRQHHKFQGETSEQWRERVFIMKDGYELNVKLKNDLDLLLFDGFEKNEILNYYYQIKSFLLKQKKK